MELLHNQVTREQGIFSIRMFHPSWGLHMIAANISAQTTVLDFPTLKRLKKELKKGNFDYVGISFIMCNFLKAKKMAELVRELSPRSKIILGGHGSQIEDLKDLAGSDYIVKGEGIRWFRGLLGDPVDAPIKHPLSYATFSARMLGLPYPQVDVAIIPGVGCWNACNFCSTTHLFGKKHLHFYDSGKELYKIMEGLERKTRKNKFFIMDENFLKHKKRFLELAEEVEKNQKIWEFDVFASAEALTQFDLDWLAKIGVATVWMGIESKFDVYPKNRNIDFKELADELNKRGIFTIFSSILFLDCHDKNNIYEDIDFILSLKPDMTQFMIYTPIPGTALYAEKKQKNELLDVSFEDRHGQYQLCHKHPNFSQFESEKIIADAFKKDFYLLGPSLYRIINKRFLKYLYTKKHCGSDPIMKKRMDWAKKNLYTALPSLFAMRFFTPNKQIRKEMMKLWRNISKELGIIPKLKYSPFYLIVLIALCIEYLKCNILKITREPKTFVTRYN
ncbi:MAG: cobalamin-dependent protein [Candidatus Margulisiibacteriota bacterium]